VTSIRSLTLELRRRDIEEDIVITLEVWTFVDCCNYGICNPLLSSTGDVFPKSQTRCRRFILHPRENTPWTVLTHCVVTRHLLKFCNRIQYTLQYSVLPVCRPACMVTYKGSWEPTHSSPIGRQDCIALVQGLSAF
jgi:hypothetical protein